ncbi:hypothetical protein K1X12_16025 [Hyphomonas sp. WL0036]|uniref:hypothetical protein n=1 Tax=Hyphomonas sediminis TaxID=2866160 RepID=UPI001C80887E|nr:hypothetical protein [Hyphomonas sediminis]MBY9068410.1 hypothetical protein [Hyphomonas sediminis]
MKYLVAAILSVGIAIPALAQVTQTHKDQQARAQNACPGLIKRHDAAVAAGLSSYYAPAEDCACMVNVITEQGWDDYNMEYTGQYMSQADAILVADTISSAGSIDDAVSLIYDSISTDGSAVLSNCFGK